MQPLNQHPLLYPTLHALHPRVHLCCTAEVLRGTKDYANAFIYVLVFDGFLLTWRGAAAIYLSTFKAIKLRITVNNTAQTCLKRQLSHFPGGESPAGCGCCFCQELHILWSRLNKKALQQLGMERPLMFHFPSFLYLTRPRPRGRWALLFISTTLFSPLFPRTAQLSAVRCAYQHTSRHTSSCVHASNGALTQFLPLQNSFFTRCTW